MVKLIKITKIQGNIILSVKTSKHYFGVNSRDILTNVLDSTPIVINYKKHGLIYTVDTSSICYPDFSA
jgi:hypothetical protein